jgi:hypothetical protein
VQFVLYTTKLISFFCVSNPGYIPFLTLFNAIHLFIYPFTLSSHDIRYGIILVLAVRSAVCCLPTIRSRCNILILLFSIRVFKPLIPVHLIPLVSSCGSDVLHADSSTQLNYLPEIISDGMVLMASCPATSITAET